MASSAYLLGFDPLTEELARRPVAVSGDLPRWLDGTLYRNGPAQDRVGDDAYRHWFDGLAMLHAFAFDGNGGVAYTNRFLRSRTFADSRAAGRVEYGEFGTAPDRSVLERVTDLFDPAGYSHNNNVNVIRLAGRLFAATETPPLVELDPTTLETLGPHTFDDDLPGFVTTAHPHHDPGRGAFVNYTVEFGRKSRYHLYWQPEDRLERELLASIPTDAPAYMHSFAATGRYVVLAEYPLLARPLELLLPGKPFIEAYHWRPERGTRFTILDKATGDVVRRAVADPFFCYHHVNAFEDGGDIVVDLPAIPGTFGVEQFYLDRLRDPNAHRTPAGELRRYRIPLADHRPVTYRLLSTVPLEFPRIHYARHNGRPYRYVYGGSADASLAGGFIDRLVKLDVETGEPKVWREEGTFPGEPVFVPAPRPEEAAEDEGVVLSLVLDPRHDRSFLLVLDAGTFDERARADLPHAIPFGFHGQYFPAGSFSAPGQALEPGQAP